MKSIRDELCFFSSLFNMLEAHMGQSAELVLYEIQENGCAAIVDWRNANLTRGETAFAKELISNGVVALRKMEGQKRYNVITTLPGSIILRSSSMVIYDDHNIPIGCIYINQDVTKTLEMERELHKMNEYHGEFGASFSTDINVVLERLIEAAQASVAVPYNSMNKQEKIEFIRYLDQRGAFLVTKAGERICNLLGISKYTMYAYLEIARSENK